MTSLDPSDPGEIKTTTAWSEPWWTDNESTVFVLLMTTALGGLVGAIIGIGVA